MKSHPDETLHAYAASLPAWECGLKSSGSFSRLNLSSVTPCVGVWIEIRMSWLKKRLKLVTPCVGVWIEILFTSEVGGRSDTSLPAWECGLKLPALGSWI